MELCQLEVTWGPFYVIRNPLDPMDPTRQSRSMESCGAGWLSSIYSCSRTHSYSSSIESFQTDRQSWREDFQHVMYSYSSHHLRVYIISQSLLREPFFIYPLAIPSQPLLYRNSPWETKTGKFWLGPMYIWNKYIQWNMPAKAMKGIFNAF